MAGHDWRLAGTMLHVVTIALAQQEDLAAICALHLRTWKAAYVGILPRARYDEVDAQLITSRWTPIFAALNPPRHSVVVAEENDKLIGVVNVSPSSDSPADVMELALLHVLPEHQGCGVGSALLAEAQRIGQSGGFRHAVAWVVSNHYAARSFYERRGWVHTGESVRRTGRGWSVQELRYRLAFTEHKSRSE